METNNNYIAQVRNDQECRSDVIDILRIAANDFKLVRASFEQLLKEERRDKEALPDDQKYEDPDLEIGSYIDSLEDAIEELEDVDSSMEDAIEHLEDALREMDYLSR